MSIDTVYILYIIYASYTIYTYRTYYISIRQVLHALLDNGPECSYPILNLIPNSTMKEFWLPLHAFDVTAQSKSGCGG